MQISEYDITNEIGELSYKITNNNRKISDIVIWVRGFWYGYWLHISGVYLNLVCLSFQSALAIKVVYVNSCSAITVTQSQVLIHFFLFFTEQITKLWEDKWKYCEIKTHCDKNDQLAASLIRCTSGWQLHVTVTTVNTDHAIHGSQAETERLIP